MNRKLSIVIQIVLVLLTLASSIYVAVTPANSLLNWYNVDDAFFYYKVAQNILAGHGFTFDQINLSNGFHPLWMVVCLGVFWLSKFGLLIPLRILVIVSGLFNAATSLLLFRFLKRYLHVGAALAGALIWGLYPPIFNVTAVLGMESAISVFFIVLLVSKAASFLNRSENDPHRTRDMVWLGVIGALTMLARLDNMFVVGVIGLFLLFRIKKVTALVIFDILTISISVFAAWIFRLGSFGVLENKLSIYPMLMLCLVIRPIVLYFSGCYLSKKPLKKSGIIFRVVLAWSISFVIEYATMWSLYRSGVLTMFSNSILILEAGIGFLLVLLVHLFLSKSIIDKEQTPFSYFLKWVKTSWKPVLIDGVSYGTPIAILIGAYMVFNKIVFGSFTPVSGQIKHWWSTMPNTVYGRPSTFLGVLGLSDSGGNGPWSILTSKIDQFTELITKLFSGISFDFLFIFLFFLILALFLLFMTAEKGKLARKYFTLLVPALLIGCIIQITYYFATGYVHTRSWYWMAEMLTIVISGSLVLDGVFSWLDTIKIKIKPSLMIVILAGLVLSVYQYRFIIHLAPMNIPAEKKAAYLEEVRAVESFTQPGSRIGMTGGGLMGYFIQDRTVVNLDGLINSLEYFNAMKAGKATQFLDAIPLNYVFGKPYMLLESDPYGSFLKNRLVEIGYIRGNEGFTLFKYNNNQ